MRALLGKARTRLGVAVIGGALLAVGGTATAAVVTSSPDTSEVADVETVPSEPAATTTPATSTQQQSPAPTTTDTPAPTVEAVTEPEPTVAPQPQTTPAAEVQEPAAEYDPTAPFEQGGVTYVPAGPPPPEVAPETQPPLG